MLENALYSVISPRGCASILWKDASREMEAANISRITADDLLQFGVCEVIIKEPLGGAHTNPQQMAESISEYLFDAVDRLSKIPLAKLLDSRYNKFRKIGVFEE